MKIVLHLFIVLFSAFAISAQVPDWFVKLQELQKPYSNIKDIENLFNSPKITYSTPDEQRADGVLTKVTDYELPEGELSVFYSTGRCSKENKYGYDLDNGVILNYEFKAKVPIEISVLKSILKGFKLELVYDKSYEFLVNKKKGISYMFYEKKLAKIEYSLPKRNYKICRDVDK